MGSYTDAPITELLLRWNSGDQSCLDQLIPLVEHELRRIAHRQMRKERAGHVLQTTALVNEAFLKLVDQPRANWRNRAQFLGVASGLMRRILLDYARGLGRAKRGGATDDMTLDDVLVFSPERSSALVALDDALQDLARMDPRKARVVELRYFGGLSIEESAEVLGVHPNTVVRDWTLARAWLKCELARQANDAG